MYVFNYNSTVPIVWYFEFLNFLGHNHAHYYTVKTICIVVDLQNNVHVHFATFDFKTLHVCICSLLLQ
jgi:hypothetical protein